MLKYIAVAVLFISSLAKAQDSACVGVDKALHTCRSMTQPLDQEMAARHFLETTFCRGKDESTYAVVTFFNSTKASIQSKVVTRTTQAKYTFAAQDLTFEMSLDTALAEGVNAKLVVTYTTDYKPKSSFECR